MLFDVLICEGQTAHVATGHADTPGLASSYGPLSNRRLGLCAYTLKSEVRYLCDLRGTIPLVMERSLVHVELRQVMNADRRRRFGEVGLLLALLCECGDATCHKKVVLSPEAYDALRPGAIVHPEHAHRFEERLH